ncbi:zinc ribbon domain-containing protein [Mycobacterium sp. GA-1285]|uniref:zinc ribbon domain-containing protein n=1 Tax=Mycobacterium sp. GA-1285 TaxID=1772282 RepID=UPI000B03DA57|nr:zinc ribbon domain-containing protein [Mycobacterium sp. GA-1285]
MTGILFPHLSAASRTTFGLALTTLAALLVGFAALRWQAPLIGVAPVGVTLVFAVYLRQARIQPVRQLVSIAALAAVLGIGWAFATGEVVAQSHDVALSGGEFDHQKFLLGTAIPVGGALLMLVPPALLRLRRPIRAPLDGYAVGALSAVVFTTAATLVRLAPQFATGVRAEDLWAGALLTQAGIQGLALPLTALALGGLFGITLWVGRRGMILASVLVTLVLYAIIGVTDYAPVPHLLHLAMHAGVAIVALAALRAGQRAADQASEERDGRDGRARALAHIGFGAVVAMAAGVLAAVLTTPDVPKVVCPPDCGRPPIGEPIESNPRFYAADGSFSVQYPGPGSAYQATLNPDGVELEFTGGDTGTLEFFGLPAEGRTPEQITEDLIDEYYPDATTEYEIPNAMVGYEPGYGVVADDYPQDASGSFTRLRLIVMVAVRNDVALVASAIGPYREFTPDFGTGHPSGANLQLAMDMGKYVNSFRWGGVTD